MVLKIRGVNGPKSSLLRSSILETFQFMNIQLIVSLIVIVFVIWRFRTYRKQVVDKDIQAWMLKYLEQHESFTVDEFMEAQKIKNNMFMKIKVLTAAADLAKQKLILSDNSGGEVFNEKKGIRFSRKI